jgi:hypothetical protein
MKPLQITANLLILLIFVLSSNCKKESITSQTGAGSIVSQTTNINSFGEIEIVNNCNVEVVTGTTNKIEYSDYENLIQYLKFEVVGNKLTVKTIPENLSIQNSVAKAKIFTAGSLNSLSIKGSGSINLLDSFNEVSQFSISGSGNIQASSNSTTINFNCAIAGSGNINLLKVSSKDAICTISGSGSIHVAVSNTLNGQITGSGSIRYFGNPTTAVTISGTGRLVKL